MKEGLTLVTLKTYAVMGGLQSLSLKTAISGESGRTPSHLWRASEDVTDMAGYQDQNKWKDRARSGTEELENGLKEEQSTL